MVSLPVNAKLRRIRCEAAISGRLSRVDQRTHRRVRPPKLSRTVWAWLAGLWAIFIIGICVFSLKVAPFDGWNRDQSIGLFQAAVAAAGFGAGGVALFLAAAQLSSLGSPTVEIRAARPIALTVRSSGALVTESVSLSAVNTGDAVAMAWHCEITVPEPLSLRIHGLKADLGSDVSPDSRMVSFNTTQRPLFPHVPLDLGSFAIVLPSDSASRHWTFKPHLDCRVTTEKGTTPTRISIEVPALLHLT